MCCQKKISFLTNLFWNIKVSMPPKSYILFLFMVLLPFLSVGQQEELVLTGVYNGKNLFVQNPLSSNMKDYCTKEVWVNEKQLFSSPRSSAFTINLSHLTPQAPVTIRIVYNNGCVPKIINPQVIRTRNNFRYLSLNVDSTQLEWVTSGEHTSGKFFIEKWTDGRWSPLGSRESRGVENSRYQHEVTHQSGENKYRIKYLQGDGETFYSSVQNYEASLAPVTFAPTRVSDKIYLSREAAYAVCDPKGNELLKGHGKEISLGHLPTGLYHLVIEDRIEKFYKK